MGQRYLASPDGTVETVTATESSSGYASFLLEAASRGNYPIRIEGVELGGNRLDREGSALSASIKVK